MPAVKAVVEVTSKGLNHDPLMWIAVSGGWSPYTLTRAVTESNTSITISMHSSQRCRAAEISMPT